MVRLMAPCLYILRVIPAKVGIGNDVPVARPAVIFTAIMIACIAAAIPVMMNIMNILAHRPVIAAMVPPVVVQNNVPVMPVTETEVKP